MMLRAFEAGTDTQEMWDRLHMNCLLELRDHQAQAPRSSLLGRRLQKEPEVIEIPQEVKAPPPPSPIHVPDRGPERRVGEEKEPPLIHYCLTLQSGKHRIALPVDGKIVLGRFDAVVNVTPDVDLSYDDRENFTVSRRHARIIGRDGQHEIEDMGSTNGTRINGMRLGIGHKARLRPGDRVGLGHCEYVYAPIPEVKISLRDAPLDAYLWVTFTGQRFPLPTWENQSSVGAIFPLGLRPKLT